MVTIDIFEYLKILAKYRKMLLRNFFVIMLLAVVASLLWPKKYKATATFVPSYTVQTPFSELRRTETPDLAFLLEGSQIYISDVYAGIMKSRTVMLDVIKKTGLQDIFKHKYMVDVMRDLERNSSIEVNEEQIITLTVFMPNAFLAAEVANAWLSSLDSLNQAAIKKQGSRDAVFIGNRLVEISQDAVNTGDSLAAFESKHRIFALEEEAKATVDIYSGLAVQLLQKEIELMKWQNASTTMPVRKSIESEIVNINRKLSEMQSSGRGGVIANVSFRELPWLQLEHAKLLQEKGVLDSLKSYLLLEYEVAKLKASVNTPTIIVISQAIPPERRAWPARAKIVLFSALVAIIFNMMAVLVLENSKLRWKS